MQNQVQPITSGIFSLLLHSGVLLSMLLAAAVVVTPPLLPPRYQNAINNSYPGA